MLRRSPVNFGVNVLCGLIAYCYQPKKPSLDLEQDLAQYAKARELGLNYKKEAAFWCMMTSPVLVITFAYSILALIYPELISRWSFKTSCNRIYLFSDRQ